MRLHSDAHSSIPTRRAPTEAVKYVVEGGGGPRERALPSGRALAGFLDPNTVTRAIKDLGRSGYRPLRSRPMAPDPASMRHPWDGGANRDAGEPHR
jgi:DNA-binding transcriptional regulator YhcF (GntR family)